MVAGPASCTTGSSGPTGLVLGGTETSGTCTLQYFGPAGAGPVRNGHQVTAYTASVDAQIATALPGIQIAQTKVTPNAASTDNYTTVAKETPSVNWGDVTSKRGTYNADLGTPLVSVIGVVKVLDPSQYLESSSTTDGTIGTNTSLYLTDGVTANFCTLDGTRPNCRCYNLAAPTITTATIPGPVN